MAGIRVNTGIKRIEVNDNGDYITLSLDDNAFLERFFALYENSQKLAEEAAGKENAIRQKYEDSGDQNTFLRETFSMYAEVSAAMMAEVDGLFGNGTCKKVFGGITPGFELYMDFFEQLRPYLEEFAKEKNQRMSRYSAARTGNV
ncbi:MAG: hypothetical protein HFF66_00780 [Oscillospiraceae bacterium]|jgi:hypothetical protein|nr:hypothetical protein [Oscillospiraceae bacterium]